MTTREKLLTLRDGLFLLFLGVMFLAIVSQP